MRNLWNDDNGVVTLEYLILATVLGLGLIVGVAVLTESIKVELAELGEAIGALDQSYTVGSNVGYGSDTDYANTCVIAGTPGQTNTDSDQEMYDIDVTADAPVKAYQGVTDVNVCP